MDKQCESCGEIKDISLFQFRKDSQKYRNECKECCVKKNREWKKENNYDRSQYIKHKEKKLTSVHDYRSNPNNKSKIRACQNAWREKQRKENSQYKLAHNLRRRCLLALNGKYKYNTTFKLVGCSAEELKLYIESLWTNGMSWKNYGISGWHIDHKIPVSSFDLSKEEEQKKAFHFSNLQPLWAQDNLTKGSKNLSEI